MQRIIFFLYYRAGSTLFECLCNKPWRLAQVKGDYQEAFRLHKEWRDSGQPFYLPTNPLCISEDVSMPFMDAFNLYKDKPHYAYMMHVGDWWGQKCSNEIPEPFEDPTPQKWGPDELADLPELDTWKFIALVRDGRSQIESLRNMKGGIEEKRNNEDPVDYFKVLCKSFRNHARMLIESKKRFPNQMEIFHYVDLIKNPIRTVEQMFSVAGLQLNKEQVVIPEGKTHSSFSSVSIIDNRFLNWTLTEQKIFNDIAGQELIELGY